jgi:hypothetical protein
MSREYELEMEILSCNGCGALAMAFVQDGGGYRITGHKCAGQWTNVKTTKVRFDHFQLRSAVLAYDKKRKKSNEQRNREAEQIFEPRLKASTRRR